MVIITFKLSDELAALLEPEVEGQTLRHRRAKKIVVDYLNDMNRHRIREEVNALRLEIVRLREDFATAIAAVMTNASKSKTPQEIQAWVENNLLS
jgi:hypothetical protein